MTRIKSFNLFLLVVGMGIGIIAVKGQVHEQKPPTLIPQKMQELHKWMGTLLNLSANDKAFSNPSNKKEIEAGLKSMMNLSHRIQSDMIAIDPDPVVGSIPEFLSDQLMESYLSFREGNLPNSRKLFRATANYCISCHRKADEAFRLKEYFFVPRSDLNDFEKAQYYGIARQYESALNHYEKAIQNPKTDPDDVDRSIRESLSILIRVQNQPDQALKWVDQLIHEKNLPIYLKMHALQWKGSILSWKNKKTIPETEIGIYREAKKLVSEALRKIRYVHDRSGEIELIRASAVLDQFIHRFPKSAYFAEMLYLAGISVDSLAPPAGDPLSNLYYESCIRNLPHTDLAEQCYRKVEENFYRTYTTLNGTQLPEEIKTRLIELWSLSMKKSRLQSGRRKVSFFLPVSNLAEMLNLVLKHPGSPLPGCFSS